MDPNLDDDRWLTALVMGGTVFIALADEAIPQGPLIGKVAGVLLLVLALPRLLRLNLPVPTLRGVLLPLAGFATFSANARTGLGAGSGGSFSIRHGTPSSSA